MKKKSLLTLFLILLSLALLTACGVFQEVEAPSATLEAIPLETQAAGVATTAVEPTAAPAEATTAPAEATTAPAEATTAPEPTVETPTEAPTGTAQVFTIDSAASQVRFQLDEDLRGERKTVVGSTDQVAGQLSLNLADLSQTQVGIIQINARTLATDNDFRNRAINNEILDTGAFEFITFTPTGIEGLPASAAIGETITFSLVGDLTIRDITQPATFTVEATAVSETQVTGTAAAVINRTDFGKALEATREDAGAVALVGIDKKRIFALGWGLGGALVGLAGAVLAIFFYIYPDVGASFALIAYVTVALGGFGSVFGAFAAGILVGVVEAGTAFILPASLKHLGVYALYLLVVVLRPRGLFGSL